MKKILLPLTLGLCAGAYAQPTNNPVLDAFPSSGTEEHFGWTFGDYSWTDEINWSTVTTSQANGADVPPNAPNATKTDITGSAADDYATIQAEIDTLANQGGGVLYIPAGTYYFSESLHLQSGVVVRGANPTQSDARQADYSPPTKFVFPRLPGIVEDPDVSGSGQILDSATAMAFPVGGSIEDVMKAVTIDQDTALTATNYGIVNIDLNRARIDFLKVEKADGTVDKFSLTFGSDEKNRMAGGNVVVFGNRINNSVELDPDVPVADSDYNRWQVWPNRAKSSIDVMAKENILIANNRLNDNPWQVYVNGQSKSQYPIDDFWMPTSGPDYSASEVYLRNNGSVMSDAGESGLVNSSNRYILFNYARGNGITANRSSRVGFGVSGPSNPAGEPTLYRDNVIVRQNWVYTNDRVGIAVSGRGLEVRDNVRRDRPNMRNWIRADGKRQQTTGSTTYENRGIDISGINTLVDNNDLEVYNRNMPLASNVTIDGEGILVQPNDAGLMYNQTITNNTLNSYLGIFKVPYNRNLNISNNTLAAQPSGQQNTRDILLLANPNFFPGIMRNVTLDGNNVEGDIIMTSALVDLTAPHTITNNTAGGVIQIPDYDNASFSGINGIVFSNISGNSPAPTLEHWTGGGAGNFEGEFPLDNVIDAAPEVEILFPTPETVLVAGNPIDVEVSITIDELGFNSLDSVILYDTSVLEANEQVFNNNHRTNPAYVVVDVEGAVVRDSDNNPIPNGTGSLELLPKAGEDIGPLGSGIYTVSWTPTQEHIDYGLFVIEALMSQVTAQDGIKNAPEEGGLIIDFPFRDSTYALLGQPDMAIIPAEDVEVSSVTRDGNTLTLIIEGEGANYSVSSNSDLSVPTSSWPELTSEVSPPSSANGQTTIEIDVSSLGDRAFFFIEQQ